MAAQPRESKNTQAQAQEATGLRDAVIIGGNRIPFAKAGSKYANASNQDMFTTVLEGLVARYGLQGEVIGEVVAGSVLKHARDFNLTRECVLGHHSHQPPQHSTCNKPAQPDSKHSSPCPTKSA